MTNTERDWMLAVSEILAKIPLPADGGGSQTAVMSGYIAYAEDMRAAIPFLQKAIAGAAVLSNMKKFPELRGEFGEFEEGLDYHHPALVLKAIDLWMKERIAQGWQKPDRYRLEAIYRSVREEARP